MRVRISFPPRFCFSVPIPVRITDLNYGGHVGNDRILAISHEARMAFLQQWNFTEMDAGGCGLIMADSAIQYKGEGFYGDVFQVDMAVAQLSSISFDLYYRISTTRENRELPIAWLKTGMICFDYRERKITAMPDALQRHLTACL